jgi:hypothetical protein
MNNMKKIQEMKRLKYLDKKLNGFLKEMIIYAIFVFLLYIVAYNTINASHYRYKNNLNSMISTFTSSKLDNGPLLNVSIFLF